MHRLFLQIISNERLKTKVTQLVSAFRSVGKFTTFGVKKQCEILTVISMQLTLAAVQSKRFVTHILSDKLNSLFRVFYCTFYNAFVFSSYSTFYKPKLLKMYRQRIAASRALEILQNFPSDLFDNDGFDSKIDPVVNAALASVLAVESDESNGDDEADDQVTHSVGPGLIQGRDGSKWRKIVVSSAAQGRLQSYNILRF